MIVATAGHIDHGKTQLVKSLTNKNTDNLPEEKKRGMSIDLGFAYADLGDGEITGFIDVPGHEKFIHTMVAGVGCVDFVILVIALDDGLKPQTFEHIKILEFLGIKKVIVAFSKIDVVSLSRADLIKNQFFTLCSGTFLENAPSVFISNFTGLGIDKLKKLIISAKRSTQNRSSAGKFRMSIDRNFSLPGAGRIVTGSAVSGEIRLGDSAMHLPSRCVIKVKDLRVQSMRAELAKTGDRCALNITGNNIGRIIYHIAQPLFSNVFSWRTCWASLRVEVSASQQ